MRSKKTALALPTGEIPTSCAVAKLIARDSMVTLYLDGTESSVLDMQDRTHLEFEYMQHMDLVLTAVFGPKTAVRALHLGAAGCSLARAWDALRPDSRQIAVDFDEKLTVYVRQWFDLPTRPRLRIRSADAREAVKGTYPGSKDVIVRDVFARGLTPPHLLGEDFLHEVYQALSSAGLYLANIGSNGNFRAELRAIRNVFPHTLVITDPKVARGGRIGNLVAAGAKTPFPITDIERSLRKLPLPARLFQDASL